MRRELLERGFGQVGKNKSPFLPPQRKDTSSLEIGERVNCLNPSIYACCSRSDASDGRALPRQGISSRIPCRSHSQAEHLRACTTCSIRCGTVSARSVCSRAASFPPKSRSPNRRSFLFLYSLLFPPDPHFALVGQIQSGGLCKERPIASAVISMTFMPRFS